MLYYDRIEISEGIDSDKTSALKIYFCHYWYFFNYSFKFQPNVCNKCHDLLIISVSLSDIAVLNIKGSLYCFIISLISKIQAKGLMQNADLTEKTGIL